MQDRTPKQVWDGLLQWSLLLNFLVVNVSKMVCVQFVIVFSYHIHNVHIIVLCHINIINSWTLPHTDGYYFVSHTFFLTTGFHKMVFWRWFFLASTTTYGHVWEWYMKQKIISCFLCANHIMGTNHQYGSLNIEDCYSIWTSLSPQLLIDLKLYNLSYVRHNESNIIDTLVTNW